MADHPYKKLIQVPSGDHFVEEHHDVGPQQKLDLPDPRDSVMDNSGIDEVL